MEARALRIVDEDLNAHKQAFLNFQVQATDRNGKPVYKHFEKFYDYEKALASVQKPNKPDKFAALKQHMREDKDNGSK